jgi:hypothetical protein
MGCSAGPLAAIVGGVTRDSSRDLAVLCDRRAGVLTMAEAQRCLGESAVRWRVHSGRWQRACRGVLVAQSGPLTNEQRL